MAYIPSGSAIVGPLTATSTSTYAAVPGSIIDISQAANNQVTYAIQETGGVNNLNVKIQTSLDQITWFDVPIINSTTTGTQNGDTVTPVAAGTAYIISSAMYNNTIAPMQWYGRYFQVVIEDATSGDHGTALVNGFAH